MNMNRYEYENPSPRPRSPETQDLHNPLPRPARPFPSGNSPFALIYIGNCQIYKEKHINNNGISAGRTVVSNLVLSPQQSQTCD
jgi:hypothetical protein